jgi:hypothetical protein
MVRPQPVAQQTPQTSRLERETGISPMQVAQARQVVQSNPAATSAVDPMLPPQWKGNPMGFINDQATQAIAWDRYATKQELAKAGSGAGSKDIAKQFSERAKAVLDALAPTGPMKEAAQAGATSVADYELKKKRAEDIQHTELANAAERWKGIFGVAQQYEEGAKTYVDRAKSVLNQPKTYTGFGGDTMQDFNKFRAIYGDTQGALYGDALAKLNSMNVLATIGTMKSEGTEAGQQASRIFAGMVDEARKTGVNINTSIAGNRFLAEMQQRLGEYAVRKRDLAQKYKAEHGGALDDNFNQVLKKDMADHPLFTKAEQQNPSLLGIPTTPYDSQGQTRAWAQQMGIKDGDPIRTPGGKIVTLHIPIYPKQQSAPP